MYFTGGGHEPSTSEWGLVQEPVVSDTLRGQCIFPGMGMSTRMSICMGSGMGSSTSTSYGAGACSSGSGPDILRDQCLFPGSRGLYSRIH